MGPTSQATAPATPMQRHPLDAVPLGDPAIETTSTPGNGLTLRKERFPFGPRMANVAKKLGMRHYLSFELDERGAAYWKQIDGTTSLRAIAETMARHLAITPEEARLLTVQFTRDLMVRGLISLRVDLPASPVKTNGQED